jgi:hypothetical protein
MATLEEIDRGLIKALEQVNEFKDSYVAVGFFEGQTHKDPQGGEDDIPLAAIAAVHEYGAVIENGWGRGIKIEIPERSFMRSWATEKKDEIAETIGSLYGQVVDGKISSKKALAILGQYGVAGIKKKIDVGPFTPLAESTLLMREHGGTKPLIDTAQMRNSIRSEVRTGALPSEGVAE